MIKCLTCLPLTQGFVSSCLLLKLRFQPSEFELTYNIYKWPHKDWTHFHHLQSLGNVLLGIIYHICGILLIIIHTLIHKTLIHKTFYSYLACKNKLETWLRYIHLQWKPNMHVSSTTYMIKKCYYYTKQCYKQLTL